MPKHSTSKPAGHFNLSINDDGTWPIDQIQAALLADIRRTVEQSHAEQLSTRRLAEQQLQVLRRIDRRLAKRIKLR